MLLRPSEEYVQYVIDSDVVLRYCVQVTSLLRLPFQSVYESNRSSDNDYSKCQKFLVRREKIRSVVSLRVLPVSVCQRYVISDFVFKRLAFCRALGAKSFFFYFFFSFVLFLSQWHLR